MPKKRQRFIPVKLNKQVCIKCLHQFWPDAESVWDVKAEMLWEEGRLYVCPHRPIYRDRRDGQYFEGLLIEHDPPEECPFLTEHKVSCNEFGYIDEES